VGSAGAPPKSLPCVSREARDTAGEAAALPREPRNDVAAGQRALHA